MIVVPGRAQSIEKQIAKSTEHRDKLDSELQTLKAPAAPSESQRSLNYRSELKRAISVELTRRPHATDLDICRALDSEGVVELPENLTTNGDRLFQNAYMGSGRHKLENPISRVRTDMRKRGLRYPPRSR